MGLMVGCSENLSEVVPSPWGYRAQIESYEGRDITTLVGAIGAPTRTVELPPDRMMYVWEDLSEMRTDTVARTEVNPSTGRESLRINHGDRVEFDCFTEATVDSEGRIVSTRTEGMGCLGRAPSTESGVRPSVAPVTASPVQQTPALERTVEAAPPAPVVDAAEVRANSTQMQRPAAEPEAQTRPRRRRRRR